MSEIYKINRVVNNKIIHIYVFAGDKDITEADINMASNSAVSRFKRLSYALKRTTSKDSA